MSQWGISVEWQNGIQAIAAIPPPLDLGVTIIGVPDDETSEAYRAIWRKLLAPLPNENAVPSESAAPQEPSAPREMGGAAHGTP